MASQLPRPWFRLGSMARPGTATTSAPVTEQPRPVPSMIRPPLIRPPAPLTQPTETASSPKPSAKSPPQLPRSAALTPPVKKAVSPPAPAVPRPVLPSPSNAPKVVPPEAKASSPKARSSSVAGSPVKSESIDKDNINTKQLTPVPSPSVPKSIPAVPSPYRSPKPKATASPLSPLLSPKPKATTSPLSPLVLPPSQLQSVVEGKHETIPQEVERKTVVFQKVMDKPTQPDHHFTNYHSHTTGFSQNGKQEQHKNNEDHQGSSKDKGSSIRAKKTFGSSNDIDKDTNTRVITMAGENRGASMEVVFSDKNNSRHHQIRQNNDSQTEDTTNNNNNNPKDNKSKKKSMGISRNVLPMKAFFNSNVQGINNSILMDSKFTHHDPGIHLVFSRNPPSENEEDEGQQ